MVPVIGTVGKITSQSVCKNNISSVVSLLPLIHAISDVVIDRLVHVMWWRGSVVLVFKYHQDDLSACMTKAQCMCLKLPTIVCGRGFGLISLPPSYLDDFREVVLAEDSRKIDSPKHLVVVREWLLSTNDSVWGHPSKLCMVYSIHPILHRGLR